MLLLQMEALHYYVLKDGAYKLKIFFPQCVIMQEM